MGWNDFSLAAVGCWYDNDDGSSRQLELRECQPGDPILLVRQPNNPHDDRAVALVTASGTCVGFLKRDRAAWIAPKIDRGYAVQAIVERVRNIDLPDATLGLVIRVSMDLPGEDPEGPEIGRRAPILSGVSPVKDADVPIMFPLRSRADSRQSA